MNYLVKKLILIKLGGSLITDKTKINVARHEVIENLVKQVKEIIENSKDLSLIIATGAGGFGHPVAKKYENNLEEGLPFIKKAVKEINQIVVDSLNSEGIKSVSIEPSKIAEYENGKIVSLLDCSIVKLLENNIVPVFHADLVNDKKLGISILSMDRFMVDMAIDLKNSGHAVEKVIFCGTTDGVLDNNGKTIDKINRENYLKIKSYFYDNKEVDTSGGMKSKVEECLKLIDEKIPCVIINGQKINELTGRTLIVQE
ncbi:MAG: isopentenyl phosphate kinase [Patescibacteria group bacterium]|jgi:isopentenyl phosphate kinase